MQKKFRISLLLVTILLCGCSKQQPHTIQNVDGVQIHTEKASVKGSIAVATNTEELDTILKSFGKSADYLKSVYGAGSDYKSGDYLVSTSYTLNYFNAACTVNFVYADNKVDGIEIIFPDTFTDIESITKVFGKDTQILKQDNKVIGYKWYYNQRQITLATKEAIKLLIE